ncbi:MAG: response regulator [Hyphomicrobiaceae bacterium]
MTRLLIADDHLLFRQGLRRLLADEADFEVVAEAANWTEVIAAARTQTIDVAILDLSMPGRGWADTIRQVKAIAPHLYILVLSMHTEEAIILAALKAGANGYMTKEDAADAVTMVIRKLARGGRYVCPQVAESITFGISSPDDRPPHARLSAREFTILEMLSAGKRGSEIASELALSEKTVSTHKVNLLRKLNLNNNAELVAYAINHGLNGVSI